MVKFSAGMWENAPHVDISWATEIVKSEAFEDHIRCIAVRLSLCLVSEHPSNGFMHRPRSGYALAVIL